MKTFKTFLPLFPGFYNTIFEPDESSEISSINYLRKENGLSELDYDDLTFDYEGYTKEVGLNACEFLQNELKKLGLVKAIRFEAVYSPKEYNYSNDSINCEIDLVPNKLKKYIKENLKSFEVYLERHYTSCSGFISHHSNNIGVWYSETSNFTNFEDLHKLGAILDFVCENEGISSEDMFMACEVYINVVDYDLETTKEL